MVQFIHRMLAYLVAILVTVWWFLQKRKYNNQLSQLRPSNYLMKAVVIQVALGIFTLLAHVPVWMGVLHQSMAFVLFASAIYLNFMHRYKTV